MDKRIKIKRWHSRGCDIEGTPQLAFFPQELFWGNYAGNEERGGHYYWVGMSCNDPDCKYRAVINADLLSELLTN